MQLISMAVAPVMICLVYMYIRDKYEKEPIRLLTTGLIYGLVITVPIIHTENFMIRFIPSGGIAMEAFYNAFMVAALVEEAGKLLVLYFLARWNGQCNEPFDGIVYSVFIALGFAGIENYLYVVSPSLGGVETAVSRALISVPGHGLFGVYMGYYFAMAKFYPQKRKSSFAKAFFYSWMIHGLYDFLLLLDRPVMTILFGGFLLFLWISGFKKMKSHLLRSPFRDRSRG